MGIRGDLLSLLELSNQSPSCSYWNDILDFFRTHRSELNIDEVKILAFESERCRERINARNEEQINEADVNPDIPNYLNSLEEKRTKGNGIRRYSITNT